MSYFIGIVTKDRYEGLDVLLKSLRQHSVPILVIDVSDDFRCPDIITDSYPNVTVYQNTIEDYKTVVHNKNIIIHNFLKTSYDYLFIIEDDVKVLDVDVFEKYIEVSEKYGLPHMNFGNPYDEMTYVINTDLQISEKLQGVFSFYTKSCIENIGLMNPKLCHNCWEHIEYTARIQQTYNYQPSFYHFPDIRNSHEYLKLQALKSTLNNSDYLDNDKKLMCRILNWKTFPEISIKRFDLKTIKNL